MGKKRIAYLDLVRVVACVLVVLVHVAAREVEYYNVESWQYVVANAFHILAFSGVPLFVMISGALVLRPEKEIGIKDLLIKKTLHFFILYYIWKFIYQIVMMQEQGIPLSGETIKTELILALVKQRGYYHLWFLPMLAILYMTVPLIKKSVAEKNVCRYFLSVFMVVALLFPTLFLYEFKFKYMFVSLFSYNDFSFFSGYLGYFILGHYLHCWQQDITAKKRGWLLLTGVAAFLLACILGTHAAREAGMPDYGMQSPFVITNFFTTVGIFLACQSIGNKREAMQDTMEHSPYRKAAELTFGIYLLHPLCLKVFEELKLERWLEVPMLTIPAVLAGTVLVSAFVTAWLKVIPILRKLV